MVRLFRAVSIGFLALGALATAGCSDSSEKKCKEILEKQFKNVPRELEAMVKDKMNKSLEACKKLSGDEVNCFDRDYRKANKDKCAEVRKKMKDAMGGE